MLRLPWYAARLRSGAIEAVTAAESFTDSGPLVVLDGNHGIGQVVTDRAVTSGSSAPAARHRRCRGPRIGHFGTAAYFTRRAAEAGCVAFLATNASPAMAPWGGRRRRSAPTPGRSRLRPARHGAVVMDLANTAVARGKIYLAAERGIRHPRGLGRRRRRHPDHRRRRAVDGLILPMAGPKGYVISFMMDVLAGVLTGSAFGAEVAGPYDPERRSGAGHLLIVIDVAAMLPRRGVRLSDGGPRRADEATRPRRASTSPRPGRARGPQRQRATPTASALPPTTWADLSTLAAESGITMPVLGTRPERSPNP